MEHVLPISSFAVLNANAIVPKITIRTVMGSVKAHINHVMDNVQVVKSIAHTIMMITIMIMKLMNMFMKKLHWNIVLMSVITGIAMMPVLEHINNVMEIVQLRE